MALMLVQRRPNQDKKQTATVQEKPDNDCKDANQCLARLCLSEHLSDVVFVCKDKVRLPAHKLILSMRSEVFQTMFYGALPETKGLIDVADIDSLHMTELLRFVYTDTPIINGTNVLGVLYCGKKYGLEHLIKICSAFLESNMNANDVCLIHKQASLYGMDELQHDCFDFMLQHAADVIKSKSFLEITPETLLSLLKNDNLAAQEIDVFIAAIQWAEQKCRKNSLAVTGTSMRKFLGGAVFQIRFPIIPMQVFAECVCPTGILTQEEQIELYEFFATQNTSKCKQFVTKKRQQKEMRRKGLRDFTYGPKVHVFGGVHGLYYD